jgi:hypothetical protein
VGLVGTSEPGRPRPLKVCSARCFAIRVARVAPTFGRLERRHFETLTTADCRRAQHKRRWDVLPATFRSDELTSNSEDLLPQATPTRARLKWSKWRSCIRASVAATRV